LDRDSIGIRPEPRTSRRLHFLPVTLTPKRTYRLQIVSSCRALAAGLGGRCVRTRFADMLVRGAWARRLALAFFVWSTVWILVSDLVVGFLTRGGAGFWVLQTEKGLIYVLVSAVLLWYAIRSFERDQAKLRAVNEQRLRSLKDSGLIGVAGIGRN